jgi:hypothetical protein
MRSADAFRLFHNLQRAAAVRVGALLIFLLVLELTLPRWGTVRYRKPLKQVAQPGFPLVVRLSQADSV